MDNQTAISLNWTPPPDRLEIVRGIENAGFPGSVLMGGALLDPYLRLPDFKDYDLWARFSDIVVTQDVPGKTPVEVATQVEQEIRERITHIPGVERITLVNIEPGDYPMGKVEFIFHGKPAELMLCNDEPSAAGMATRATNIPISAIAMDSSGQVVAHPLFEEHLNNKIFAPQNPGPQDEARFEKLAKKIPGLRLAAEVEEPGLGKWTGKPRNQPNYQSQISRGSPE